MVRVEQRNPSVPQATAPETACEQRVGALTAIPELIRQLGGDPEAVLASAGLEPSAYDDPEGHVPYRAVGRTLSEAAARTGCAHFGLLAGRASQLTDFGVVGEIMRHSPTVGAALQALVVHQHLNSEGALAFLREYGSAVDLGYAIYLPDVAGGFHLYDAGLASGLCIMRGLCGAAWVPAEVHFPHSPPVDTVPYRRWFKAPLRFNAEFGALRFPSSWMSERIPGADPGRLREAQKRASAADRGHLVQKTSRALRTLLLQGPVSGTDVAQALAMHRRTLNRRLSAEGTTFQEILDTVRFAVAQDLLRNSEVNLHDIAAALGYAGLTPFMRAFRRWTGTSPGHWRNATRAT
jgi:AraC-like DNA-binding protein